MSEQDLKYLLATYQQKSFDLFSQSIANDAKIRQLNDLIESLSTKLKQQEEEISKLKQKPKRTSKTENGDYE
jgi:predicted RNase H-like nuclease (RuvC/YqgF family)